MALKKDKSIGSAEDIIKKHKGPKYSKSNNFSNLIKFNSKTLSSSSASSFSNDDKKKTMHPARRTIKRMHTSQIPDVNFNSTSRSKNRNSTVVSSDKYSSNGERRSLKIFKTYHKNDNHVIYQF